jgi:V/A-type H+-transporting ATPase subunit C
MRDFTTLKDIDYASAVAAVRAAESGLLDEQDAERIISARSMGDAYAVLSAKGIRLPENENDMLAALDGELERAWDFIKSYAPQSRELEILLYRNDFHNLKAALKSLMMNSDPARCFILPTLLDLSALPKTVSAGKFDELPEYMREPAEDAYRALTENSDGQLAEVILDCAALKAMRDCAKEQGSEFMERLAEELCVCADIKTAYRSAAAGKREGFLEAAICGSDSLAKEPLVRAALRGTESVISHIENSPFAELAEALKESSAAFEKLCDDRITELAESAKMKAFGAEPLAAYYLAKEAEIKNLRIILVCKRLGVSEEIIRERTRRLYV